MGKIAKKKKGRPSKADLARRTGVHRNPPPPTRESELRRSLRRRNPTYNDDFDDYDDEDEDEEVERRREKKLKLVLKLPHKAGFGGVDSSRSLTHAETNVAHASAPESAAISASSSDYGNGNNPFKKRRIDGDDVDDAGDGDDPSDDVRSIRSGDKKKERVRNGDSRGVDSVPGTPADSPSGIPLPDKKSLELMLDKLQKKDTYGVYAEPVDPEELPDYHDVIEHPMDFSTVRKKLANGAYFNLEQFESDVFLICTNAMQYNAPETIYFKQARSIQELARKKFQRLRIDLERCEIELKSEQKSKSNSLKKPSKKSSYKTAQEPVGSDFSSGATLATTGDNCSWLNTTQAGICEKPNHAEGLVDGNSSLTDNKPEKAEEQLAGKGIPSKFGRKPFVLDENRRLTYNISNQPVVRTESILTTFEGEDKQLVAVGLHAHHSYARSLARFAATLGSVAWKVASRRIEQALPVGYKFGRGWVGEYEPLPTPVLILESRTQKEPVGSKNFQSKSDMRKHEKAVLGLNSSQNDIKVDLRTINSSEVTSSCMTPDAAKEHPIFGPSTDGKPGFFVPAGTKRIPNPVHQQHNQMTKDIAKPDSSVLKKAELNSLLSDNGMPTDASLQKLHGSEMTTSRLLEMVSRNRNLVQSVPFKQPNTNGIVTGGLPDWRAMGNGVDGNRVNNTSSDFVSSKPARAVNYFPHGSQEQGLSDPVQLMRMLSEQAQNQQKSSSPSPVAAPLVIPSAPSSTRGDSSAAATTAARAWMSVGSAGFNATEGSHLPKMQIAAASLYNPAREHPSSIPRFREEPHVSGGLQLQSEKGRLLPPFLPQPVHGSDEAQFQSSRQMVFPQLVTTDLSRFQVQSSWRGLSPHTQPRKKQEMLPPDLNISFQSSGSPPKQSSSVMTDSQQPDLALQL